MAKDTRSGDTIVLSPDQTYLLQSAKTWWLEGERRLDYLAERARYRDLLEQTVIARDRFRVSVPSAAEALPMLRLARAFAPNVALNRDRGTDAFAVALYALLFSNTPLSERLTDFLDTVRGAGAITASQLLFVAYPDRYPFVTRNVTEILAASPEQKRAAQIVARERFGNGDNAQATSLLKSFAFLDTVRAALHLPDFADLHAVLRCSREMPKAATRRRRGNANAVREAGTAYHAASIPEPTEAHFLRYLEAFAATQGLTYPSLALRNYYLCHKTKPFVILAGLSGTGKTRLTELFAEVVTGDLRTRYRLLPVRPDWSDGSPLLGYHNALSGRYIGTPFLETLREAGRAENSDHAYFVCLDEMNLARAEHYLADVLSVMETRERTIPLAGTFDAVRLPANVFLSGTVNIEEGTHPFGAKVLDRANVIEFGAVQFTRTVPPAPEPLYEITAETRERLFLSNRVESVSDAETRLSLLSPDYVDRFYETLSAFSGQLSLCGFAFGYRVRDESLRYLAHSFAPDGEPLLLNGSTGAENARVALDLQLLQRVLPRVSGTQERLSRSLATVADWADAQGLARTATKLRRMLRRAEDDGIVSFWE